MPMPKDIGVIDLMLAIPGDDSSTFYDWIKPLLMDRESHDLFSMPAQYMFKDIPDTSNKGDATMTSHHWSGSLWRMRTV